jgi:hypothetical protein
VASPSGTANPDTPAAALAFAYTGHRQLDDGSVIRVDLECRQFVGRYYRPNMTTLKRMAGDREDVLATVAV